MSRYELIASITRVSYYLHGEYALRDLHSIDTKTLYEAYHAFVFELKLTGYQKIRCIHNGECMLIKAYVN